MTYLYNNDRVYNFALNSHNNQMYHENMSMVIKNIEQWNHLLIRKDTGSLREGGVRLEVAEIERHIQELERKLAFMKFLPESDWKNKGIFVALYLWLYHRVIHVLSIPIKELKVLETKLATGINYVPCDLIDILQRQHKANTKMRLLKEQAKLFKIKVEEAKGEEERETAEDTLRGKESEIRAKIIKYAKICEAATAQSSFKVVVPMIFGLLARYSYSAVDSICFFFMIMAQCMYGNLLSLFYVVFLFAYAVVVRCRPHRWYWRLMLFYSGLVIILKVVCGNMATFLTKYVCVSESNCSVIKLFENLQVNVSLFAISRSVDCDWDFSRPTSWATPRCWSKMCSSCSLP